MSGVRGFRALRAGEACSVAVQRCHTQTSAGTIFAATKLDLTVRFRAMFHMTQTKQGISALELSRRIDVSDNTAWAMHHKLRQVMLERNREKPLEGRIEMDDAHLGGERSGGKRGRGSPGKTPFLAAVGKAQRVKLRAYGGSRRRILRKSQRGSRRASPMDSAASMALRTVVVHTSRSSPAPLARPPVARHSGRSTRCGNIKSSIAATFRSGSRKHAPRRLAEFEYRFNRRCDLPAMIPRLPHALHRCHIAS